MNGDMLSLSAGQKIAGVMIDLFIKQDK